jgi:tRNA(adenine34) deaminase
MMTDERERFMGMALEEARRSGELGNRAVGAVIVRGNEVLGRGGNQREATMNPVGHAEIEALREAVTRMQSLDFAGCTLYTTLEPCPMCAGAIIVNGIHKVVVSQMHGEGDRRWGDYSARKIGELAGTDIRIEEGVLLDECSALLREYDFQQGRS